ncbi:MAG TPA: twin-arginine translocation signal domain-containing protein, partial [Saprospiraceae bacterium]|nr:twin-arginine translocation signal domain-containing protein [Saprospiraceae bacterium]
MSLKKDRRDFLKLSSLAGLGLAGNLIACSSNKDMMMGSPSKGTSNQNMSGYAAPKLEKVRIGFIGLGMRGPGAVERMSYIDGVEINGLCDLRPEKAEQAKKILEKTKHKPTLY